MSRLLAIAPSGTMDLKTSVNLRASKLLSDRNVPLENNGTTLDTSIRRERRHDGGKQRDHEEADGWMQNWRVKWLFVRHILGWHVVRDSLQRLIIIKAK